MRHLLQINTDHLLFVLCLWCGCRLMREAEGLKMLLFSEATQGYNCGGSVTITTITV